MSEKKELNQELLEKVNGGAGYDSSKYYLFRNREYAAPAEFGPYLSEEECEEKGFKAIKNSLSGGIKVVSVEWLHNNEYTDRTRRYYDLLRFM